MTYSFTRTGAQIEEIHNTVDDPKSNTQFSNDIRTIAGEYRGLWPVAGGSANKGDTYQTQESGSPTGHYFTALKVTTTDPVDDNLNWISSVSKEYVDGKNQAQDSSISSNSSSIESINQRVSTNELNIASLQDGQGAGVVAFATQAELFANLDFDDKTTAYVTNDPSATNNGTYRKEGSSGSGLWVQSSNDLASQAFQLATEHDPVISEFEELFKDANNLIANTDGVVGFIVDNTNGQLVASANSTTTPPFEVEPSKVYQLREVVSGTVMSRYAFYDNSSTFISGGFTGVTQTAPVGAAFMRYSYFHNSGAVYSNVFVGLKEEVEKRIANSTPYIPSILADRYEISEAGRLADGALIGSGSLVDSLTNDVLTHTMLEHRTVNLFDRDKASATLNTTISSNGYVVPTASNIATQDIPVKPNTVYSVETQVFRFVKGYWLDGNKVPLVSLGMVTDGPTAYTSTSMARFLRIGAQHTSSDFSTYQGIIVEGSTLPAFSEYSNVYKVKSEYLPGSKGNKDWSNYKYAAMGDSRTAGYASNLPGSNDDGYQYTRAYPDTVAGGWNYVNDINYNTAITIDNRSAPGAAWAFRSGIPNIDTMYEQLSGTGTNNLTPVALDTDILTVHAGTNDRPVESNPTGNEVLMDDPQDLFRHDTFKGSIRLFCRYFFLNYPEKNLLFIVDANTDEKNTAIQEIAKDYRVPTIRLHERGQNTLEFDAEMKAADPEQQSYFTDGLHESVRGQKIVGRAVAGEMAKYLW